MTARVGGFYDVQPAHPAAALHGLGGTSASFYAFQLGPIYKNQGWYTAGSTYEIWISVGTPSNNPPSGHALTQIQYVQLT